MAELAEAGQDDTRHLKRQKNTWSAFSVVQLEFYLNL